MGANYIFSLEPTFTQGLVLGQLSVIVLLGLILKYIFLESTHNPFDTSGYQTRADNNFTLRAQKPEVQEAVNERQEGDQESAEWFNTLLRQVVDVYRSKLRDDLPSAEGDEIARKRIEDYANKIRPAGFLDHIKIHSVDLGVSAPRLHNARLSSLKSCAPFIEIECDTTYTDTLSISLSTSYLFNYPMSGFARLPVSLTVSLSQFKSSINITPPSPNSLAPVLTFSISPDFTLDLTTTSLMGSRAKLANVPKLHELIQHQVRRILAARGTWKVVLPGLATVSEAREQVQKEMKEEQFS
ncbi:putative component of the ERMES MDM complex, which serves as a molecular tether to connect the endoplasmic reticulum and mitochondria [Lyophyllum shimeji]|uniref:Maintenance of mitochondrial morphology protein 1 n=1 Tax=Lyophyllum shimeji TaxID=47721 RepID=A0A9P3PHZ8_LYOSH|nr:putative component of the ERMES MDM complex, which serves as a molecular tether to connect the endoplasmic reticulum and mitochondria [Lyophyllum shimeji]